MTMLLLKFRQSFDQNPKKLLKKLGVKAFTDVSKVDVIGQSGTHFSSFAWPGHHSMIIAAMVEQ